MAALICTKAGHRPRLIYRIHLDRGPARHRRKGCTENDYARCSMPPTSSSAAPSIAPGLG
ncbi:hypothetical protein ACH47Z_42440 [Streptomyces sp. NPDC020192]|uniref:hypothetical protein n=1 Tax=Streptomyces sp. NPDC020192 TaxID=3365066 RepID=UPI003788E55C